MIRAAICEDDKFFIKHVYAKIRTIFDNFQEEYILDCFVSGKDFLEKIRERVIYDLVFLDIDMPEIDGISIGVVLRKNFSDVKIIYISSREYLVFDSFKTNPYSFIPKSRLDQMLLPTLSSLYHSMHAPEQLIIFSAGGIQYRWNALKLIYVECIDRILYIHFEDRVEEIYYTLKEMEQILEPHGFLRTHKSFLINYRFIYSIGKNEVVLDTKECLPLSKRRANETIQKFHKLMQG